mmetsp:Transcript_98423/g.278740  ORF Transcript_98423/g.278740 Transcript_98423/m.278740 type:complete len:207 (+) Transcript_98423:1169-1789(+)
MCPTKACRSLRDTLPSLSRSMMLNSSWPQPRYAHMCLNSVLSRSPEPSRSNLRNASAVSSISASRPTSTRCRCFWACLKTFCSELFLQRSISPCNGCGCTEQPCSRYGWASASLRSCSSKLACSHTSEGEPSPPRECSSSSNTGGPAKTGSGAAEVWREGPLLVCLDGPADVLTPLVCLSPSTKPCEVWSACVAECPQPMNRGLLL